MRGRAKLDKRTSLPPFSFTPLSSFLLHPLFPPPPLPFSLLTLPHPSLLPYSHVIVLPSRFFPLRPSSTFCFLFPSCLFSLLSSSPLSVLLPSSYFSILSSLLFSPFPVPLTLTLLPPFLLERRKEERRENGADGKRKKKRDGRRRRENKEE